MTRRDFLKFSGAGVLMLGGCKNPIGCSDNGIKLAMAGYTLNKFNTAEALRFCKEHGFTRLCVKNFHLPYSSSPAQIAEFRRQCADNGVTPYAVGPISMHTADESRKYFDYAAELGVDLIVGVPGLKKGTKWTDVYSDRNLCEVCSTLADEYRMRYAIHNHGRNPKTGNPNLYPAVPETIEIIKDLSPRMGLCVDWAYTFADSLDCQKIVRNYRERIFDGHVRCISDVGNGSSGTNPSSRIFDYDAIISTLKEVGYRGCLSLELANAFPAHVEWIDESRQYFERLISG